MARATTSYKRRHGLTVEQLNAIDLLVCGEVDREVALAVGVHRTTVTNWRNKDPDFQAELNRRRKEIWSSSVDRLRSLLPVALDALEHELQHGKDRARVALEVMRIAGFYEIARNDRTFGNYEVGPSDADVFVDVVARNRRASSPLERMLDDEPVSDRERDAAYADLMAFASDLAESGSPSSSA